jgi:hypothetical protein
VTPFNDASVSSARAKKKPPILDHPNWNPRELWSQTKGHQRHLVFNSGIIHTKASKRVLRNFFPLNSLK